VSAPRPCQSANFQTEALPSFVIARNELGAGGGRLGSMVGCAGRIARRVAKGESSSGGCPNGPLRVVAFKWEFLMITLKIQHMTTITTVGLSASGLTG
jgi:hypothetical protein